MYNKSKWYSKYVPATQRIFSSPTQTRNASIIVDEDIDEIVAEEPLESYAGELVVILFWVVAYIVIVLINTVYCTVVVMRTVSLYSINDDVPGEHTPLTGKVNETPYPTGPSFIPTKYLAKYQVVKRRIPYYIPGMF